MPVMRTHHACVTISFFLGRLVYKISSHDSFDRYRIPFGEDNAKIEFWTYVGLPMAEYL